MLKNVSVLLGGIHKNLIPLYSLVMSKNHSKVELVATDKTRKNEYQINKAILSKPSYSK